MQLTRTPSKHVFSNTPRAILQQNAIVIWLTWLQKWKLCLPLVSLVSLQIIGFDKEKHQVDFYYYLNGSAKSTGVLMEYLKFVDQEWTNSTGYIIAH